MASDHHGGTFVVARGEADIAGLRGAVVAIGNFDGVHRGHQRLIESARALAERRSAPAAILTFEPHPRAFFAPGKPMFRLTPETEKLIVLRRLGLDGVIVRRFDADLAATTAEDFVTGLLVRDIGASGVVVGHDFHFGKGRAGTPEVLADLARRQDIACEVVPVVAEDGEAVSSSAIRAALEAGAVERANRLLGYIWFATGDVRHGEKRGRDLGYPTANMRLPDGCGLRHGIYAVRMAVDGVIRDGVASFGRRPTFDNGAPLLETFLFEFSGDLYGKTVAVEFVSFLRGEERFESIADLVAQMDRDSAASRAILAQPATERSMIA